MDKCLTIISTFFAYSKSNTILTESAPSRCPEDRFIHRPIYGNGTLNSISKIKKRRVKPSPKIGEPIILISDLNSDHNVTKMVDQLLTKRELANDSSLIMVVPLSDDENGSSCGGFDSTVFNIHLADNSKWNKTPDQDAELGKCQNKFIISVKKNILRKCHCFFFHLMEHSTSSTY